MFKRILSFSIIALTLGISACEPDPFEEQIPFQPFEDIFINITLPAYTALQVNEGHVVIPNGGIKGIILYRVNSTTFRAFEQTCSFQPNTSICAFVEPNAFNMQDAGCCGSTFNYEGNPIGGMAQLPLGQYEVRVAGTMLTITDNVINY